jgi:hypothetical protein
MTAGARVDRQLQQWGRQVTLYLPQGEITVHAMLQPLRYKNKMYLGGAYLPTGFEDGGHYLYIGERRCRLDRCPAGVQLAADGQRYLVKRAEAVYLGEEALYVWAVVRRCEEETDGTV